MFLKCAESDTPSRRLFDVPTTQWPDGEQRQRAVRWSFYCQTLTALHGVEKSTGRPPRPALSARLVRVVRFGERGRSCGSSAAGKDLHDGADGDRRQAEVLARLEHGSGRDL